MTNFTEIAPEQLGESAFKIIGKDGMLITAGGIDSFNTMTASWGGLGVIWGKNVCYCVIRPQRYTYQFMEDGDRFTLTFFDKSDKAKRTIAYCGTKSGRDVDKVKETGLTPVQTESGSVYFDEARIVLECRKIYFQDIDPANFLDPAIADNYPEKDYHRMYIGEIVRCMVR
jgi:flavin reductase (DIM6/NTAB) family NADH-FMN oxidoreductase RutF